jgi:hypothetical protein
MLKLSADNRDLKAKLDEANAKLKGMSGPSSPLGKLQSMFSAANVAIMGVVGVFGFLASKILGMARAAMNAEKQQAQLNAVLRSTGHAAGLSAGEVNRIATELSNATAASRSTILSGQTMLLTFTNIGRDVFPAATEALLDMTHVMTQGNVTAEAMSSQAIRLGRALNDPITGMTALRRVGVQFTEQQMAQVTAMVRTNNIAGAQAIILRELQREFGGSASAFGGTAAGQIQRLENAMAGLRRETGEQLLPGIRDLAGALTNLVKADSFHDGAKGIATDISTIMTGISGLIQLYTTGGGASGNFAAAMISAITPITAQWEYFMSVVREVYDLTGSPPPSSAQAAKTWADSMNPVMASWDYTLWAIGKFNELMGNTPPQRLTTAIAEQDRITADLVRRYGSIGVALQNTGDAGVAAYRRIQREISGLILSAETAAAVDPTGLIAAANALTTRQQPPAGGGGGNEWYKKQQELIKSLQGSWQQYYQFIGNEEAADTAQLQSNYDKQKFQFDELLRYRVISQQQYNQALIGLEAGRFRQEEELAIKHNIALRTIQEDWLNGFKSAYSSFESATKDALQETLTGENGWDAWQKSMKKILQQLVVDLGYAVAKALLLQAVSASIGGPTGVGGGFIGGMIKKAFFEKGYMPSYAKGHIPVLASGSMPSDHFPAYIGTREAVINAESTRANYGLLAAMNANPGASLGGGGDMNITVNAEVDGEVLFRVNEKRRNQQALAMGAQNYGRRSVYR